MNKQLSRLQEKAGYFTPAKTVDLDASGGANPSKTIQYAGLDSNRYGVNRFLAGGNALNKILATAEFNQGKDTKFEDVHLSCINQLFRHRSLRGAFIIGANTKMDLTLENLDNSAHSPNVQLIGYDDEHLQEKEEQYKSNGKCLPKPEFVYLPNTQIAAGASNTRLAIDIPAYPLRMYRLAFGTDDTGNNLEVYIRQGTKKIKPKMYLSQINDEFSSMDIILPQNLEAHTPFELYVSNADGANPYQLSMLAECYKLEGNR